MKKGGLICLLFFLVNIFAVLGKAQDKTGNLFKPSKSLEHFNRIADYKSKNLVFKFLQFNAPFGGVYYQTELADAGKVFTVRVTPFAYQTARRAKLSEAQIETVKKSLSNFTQNNCVETLPPEDGKLYSTLVFNNGKSFSRCNFIGEIPNELQKIKDFLKEEYDKEDERELAELQAKEKLVKEKYGDWEKNPNLVRYSASGFRSLENKNMILLYLKGKQQPVTKNSREIPLYYALVSYPNGRTTGGAGGGTWSFEPYSKNGITWTIADNPHEIKKELMIEYSVIDGTISTKNKIYKLKRGNLFIIKFDKNWNLRIKQLKNFIKEPTDDQKILSVFEKESGEKLSFPQQK